MASNIKFSQIWKVYIVKKFVEFFHNSTIYQFWMLTLSVARPTIASCIDYAKYYTSLPIARCWPFFLTICFVWSEVWSPVVVFDRWMGRVRPPRTWGPKLEQQENHVLNSRLVVSHFGLGVSLAFARLSTVWWDLGPLGTRPRSCDTRWGGSE